MHNNGGRPHLTPSGLRRSRLVVNDSMNGNSTVSRSNKATNIAERKIDAIGEFIELDTNILLDLGSWNHLFHSVKGRSNFSTALHNLLHRATPFLLCYAQQGVPVVLKDPPWTLAQKDAAITRGNHPSTKAYSDFIHEEMTDMRSKGMFIILPYSTVCHLTPLQLSPLGCVLQRERRPQIINDYTFSGVNPNTVKMAPSEAIQWGRTLNRVLWYILHVDNQHGPVLMSKTELSDGFYQMRLTPTSALKLAVPFQYAGREPMVAIPTRLPMGWTESPPAFSMVTETIPNLINESLEQKDCMPPPHPLESKAATTRPLLNSAPEDSFFYHQCRPDQTPSGLCRCLH